MTSKIDKILDEVWSESNALFENVSDAVSILLNRMIASAIARGVPERVAIDTYVDWLRQKMHEDDFM